MSWATLTLGELCERHNGKIQTGPFGSQLHQSDYKSYGIPVVMPKDIVDDKISLEDIARISEDDANRLAKHQLEVGDIIFPRRGEISKRALITKNEAGFLCGTGCIKISINSSDVFNKYIHYFLARQESVNWLENNAVGSTMKNLSGKILGNIPIELPPLPTQRRIASILSAYDGLIENNLKRIRLLEEAAQNIYREWFVHFRFPGHEQAEFGEDGVPVGWEDRTLSDLTNEIADGTHDSPKPADHGYYLVTGKHIKNGTIDFSSAYLISEEDHNLIKRRSFTEKGNILFSNIGTVGNTAIVDQDFEFSCKNVIIFRPLPNHTYFLYCFLTNGWTKSQFL